MGLGAAVILVLTSQNPRLPLSPGLTPAKSALAPRLLQNGKTMCSKPPLGLRG